MKDLKPLAIKFVALTAFFFVFFLALIVSLNPTKKVSTDAEIFYKTISETYSK